MRFLFGVMIGGALTLAAATAFNPGLETLFGRADGLTDTGSAWQRALATAGKTVFPPVEETKQARTAVVEVPFQAAPVDQSDPSEAPPSAKESATVESVAPSDTPESTVFARPPAALEPLPELETPPLVATHQDLEPTLHGVEPVWLPFRSATSAEGFAARLQAHTQHPFHVTREGPGRYQVNFSYANASQREALLAEIQGATGQVE